MAQSYARIAYYISAHGYGHGVRSSAIIRAINERYPRITVHIVSDLPLSFLEHQTGKGRNPIRPGSFDVGMVQIDSIRVDVDATLERAVQFQGRRRERVEQESAFLASSRIDLVVADIPALPIEAAAFAGIPRIAVGNFGWDWIYSEFTALDSRWPAVVEMFREQYAKTNLLLRLPFCEAMEAFPRIEDLPLVARPGRSRRAEIAAMTGCDPRKKWILLSFTTLDWNEKALSRVEGLTEYEFLTVLPLKWERTNIHALDREAVAFSDVIASSDAVVSKPGFGILSDCIVNRKPLIYADRSNFLEYPVLEVSIRKYLAHLHIPASRLYDGELGESLDSIWARPGPEMELTAGGDIIAADRIAGFVGMKF